MKLLPKTTTIPRTLFAIIVGLALAAGISLPALAAGLVDASDRPTVAAGQVVDGSAYLSGNVVTVEGTIQGDLYCVANSVNISGTVEGDVLCAGSAVTVGGRVAGDVRAAGNTVSLTGTTDGSATLAGNAVRLAADSTIGRDTTVGGNSVSLAGEIARDVRLAGSVVRIDGSVGRDVDGDATRLTVAPGANIAGNLHYTSQNDATIADGTVAGDVTRTDPPPQQVWQGPTLGQRILWTAVWIAGFVLLSVVLALILPRFVQTSTAIPRNDLVKAGLIGLLVGVVGPPIIVLAFVSVVGIPLGVLLWLAYGVLALVGAPLAAYVIGREIVRGGVRHPVAIMAIGAAILAAVAAIPFIGWIVGLVALWVGVGLVILGLRPQYSAAPATVQPAMVGVGATSYPPAEYSPPADYRPPVGGAAAPERPEPPERPDVTAPEQPDTTRPPGDQQAPGDQDRPTAGPDPEGRP